MIKKINQYLITHHPQLWNTKLVWMLLAIATTHAVFYIAGYLHFDDWAKLHTYNNITPYYVESLNIGFSILASTLLLIIWLVYYLRNNPFKSFYPLKPFYFITEFAIITGILFSSIMFYKTYALGFCHAIKKETAHVKVVEEVNTFNLAYALMPERQTYYKLHACCDSVDYLDSLRKINEGYSYLERHTDEDDIEVDQDDSVPLYNIGIAMAINSYLLREREEHDVRLTHYCQKEFKMFDSLTYSKYQLSAQLQQWLTTGNKTAVQSVLKRFEDMCRTYKIVYTVNITDFATYAFADKQFRISHLVSESPLSTRQEERDYVGYVDYDELKTALRNVRNIQNPPPTDYKFWLLNIFLALNLAVLLFTFRLTPIRVWFTAVAAHLALPVVVGLAETLIMVSVGYQSDNEKILPYLAIGLILFIAVLVYVMHFMLRKYMKKTAGVLLVWTTWWLLYFGGVVYALLLIIYTPKEVLDAAGNFVTQPNPVYDFLEDQVVPLAASYMLFAFLYIGLVLSRHYRKWMALPEE